jgi:hypothetical protein
MQLIGLAVVLASASYWPPLAAYRQAPLPAVARHRGREARARKLEKPSERLGERRPGTM